MTQLNTTVRIANADGPAQNHKLSSPMAAYPLARLDGSLTSSHSSFDGAIAGPPPLPQASMLPLLILALLAVCVLSFLGIEASWQNHRSR